MVVVSESVIEKHSYTVNKYSRRKIIDFSMPRRGYRITALEADVKIGFDPDFKKKDGWVILKGYSFYNEAKDAVYVTAVKDMAMVNVEITRRTAW